MLRNRHVTRTAKTCVALTCLLTVVSGGDAQERKGGRGRQAGTPEAFFTEVPAYERIAWLPSIIRPRIR